MYSKRPFLEKVSKPNQPKWKKPTTQPMTKSSRLSEGVGELDPVLPQEYLTEVTDATVISTVFLSSASYIVTPGNQLSSTQEYIHKLRETQSHQ